MEFLFLNRVTALMILGSLIAALGAAWLRTF